MTFPDGTTSLPTPKSKKVRKKSMRYTEDMKRKIALEYSRAKKHEKRAIVAKYNISISSASTWVHQYAGKPAKQQRAVKGAVVSGLRKILELVADGTLTPLDAEPIIQRMS